MKRNPNNHYIGITRTKTEVRLFQRLLLSKCGSKNFSDFFFFVAEQNDIAGSFHFYSEK